MLAVRSLTTVGAVDGRDMDIRVVVAHRAVVLGDEADLVPMVIISVASRVIAGMSVLFVPNKDHFYNLGALIARVGLHHFRVYRDKLNPASPVSPPLIRPIAVPTPVSSSGVWLLGLYTRISGTIWESRL